jgi:hypothetical protein
LYSCTAPAFLHLLLRLRANVGMKLRFGGVVEAGGAEGVAGPGGVGEACSLDELDHAWGAGEALDRGGEIAVGSGFARDEAA